LDQIIYNEFLPTILGSKLMSRFRLGSGPSFYDPKVKPTIFTEFSTAAYRFGHSMIQNKVSQIPKLEI
jgi:peroxidase